MRLASALSFLRLPKQHILTSAECGIVQKQFLRSRYESTDNIISRVDGVGGHNIISTAANPWIPPCNLFVLTGYETRQKAVDNNAPLRRTKSFIPHEKAFKYGYKYNIGNGMLFHLVLNLEQFQLFWNCTNQLIFSETLNQFACHNHQMGHQVV